MDYLFYKLQQDLCRASGFVSKVDGSFVSLTANAKIVYTYMLQRNHFFVEVKKGMHYETQTTIGEACCVEYRTVMKIMKEFKTHGVIESKMIKVGGTGYVSYSYKRVDPNLILWIGKKDSPKVLERKKYKVIDSSGEPEYSDDFLASIDFTGGEYD